MHTAPKKVAIVGSGPAALMAADVVSSAGHSVSIYEKRKSAGRKLLVAGSSGLNISNGLPLPKFVAHYSGPPLLWKHWLEAFTPQDWVRFIEAMGISTFEGTSGRTFIEDMKASKFLQAWCRKLKDRQVQFVFDRECVDFTTNGRSLRPIFSGGLEEEADAICFCLGGGSWEPNETPLRWPEMFKKRGIEFAEFTPSNVGYKVAWPQRLLEEAEGKPLKNIVLSSPKGSRKGEAMITAYGMEGTPVYFVGKTGEVRIDLKPDLTEEQIASRLSKVKENLSPIRRVDKLLGLCEASFALLFHLTPPEIMKKGDLRRLAHHIKNLPILFGAPQPLSESISSAGGISLKEIDERLMLRKAPGIFCAGEMLDWDAPTGGFLIQACVSQGFAAGQAIVERLAES